MPTSRNNEYKPLLFTTTVRNPSRLKALLSVLHKFNSQELTNDLSVKIMGELIRYGLYRPTRAVSSEIEKKWGSKRITDNSTIGLQLLADDEVATLLDKNPQAHKEAGFDRGWPSRFATVFDLAKELGFVFYTVGEKIEFSEIGSKLANSIEIKIQEDNILVEDTHPEFEQQAFLHALAKYQRKNPFVRVLNDNAPLILLLEVIQKINADNNFNASGISKLELPLFIYWKNNDSEALYQRIKKLRNDFGYSPTWETICDICRNEIMQGEDSTRKDKSIMLEYPDEYIRKMRLTGLISLRGGGRFVDINKNEQEKVDYILKVYSTYNKYPTEREYFNYVSTIDENLVTVGAKAVTIEEKDRYLEKWVNEYSWPKIREEMTNLADKKLTKDDVLKYLSNPIRLEFLTAIAIKSKFPNIKVIANYPVDDEGLPTSTAAGVNDMGDIECYENHNGVLVEVTMSEGRSQTMMEVWPITRHLEKFSKKTEDAMCYFVAPSLYTDSIRQIDYSKQQYNISIVPKTIKDFLNHLESTQTLYV